MATHVIIPSGQAGYNSSGNPVLSIENKTFYEKALLSRLVPSFKLYALAKKKVLPKNVGRTISWRKFCKLSLPQAALTEGVTPTPNSLTILEYQDTVAEYGDFVELSNITTLNGIDPVLTETSELFGEQIAEYFDYLVREELVKSTNNLFITGSADSAIAKTDTITIAAIAQIKALMQKRHVAPWVDGKYLFIINSEVEYDLKNLSANGFIEVWKYAKPDEILQGEIGEFMGFKFIVNDEAVKITQGKSYTSGETTLYYSVANCIVLGKVKGESPFGVIELEGNTGRPQIIYKGLGSGGTSDPLNQKQTLGWEIPAFKPTVLYEEGVMVFHVGTSLDNSLTGWDPAAAGNAYNSSTHVYGYRTKNVAS